MPVGRGSIDLPPILACVKMVGVKRYPIEDEAEKAAVQIPQSLQSLYSNKL